jgi:Chitobiase/beta-hexosaminidase C-terminal domain
MNKQFTQIRLRLKYSDWLDRIAIAIFIFAVLSSCVHAQSPPWTGIISTGRAIDWRSAGVEAGLGLGPGAGGRKLPSLTWTQSGSTITAASCSNGTVDCGPTIRTALAACGTNHYVQLGAGLFRINAAVVVPSGCELRSAINSSGVGNASTVVIDCFVASGACLAIGLNSGGASDSPPSLTNATAITGGLTAGSTSIQTSSKTGMTVGQYLVITQLNDPTITSNSATANNGLMICNCDGGIGWTGTRNQGQIVEITSISGSSAPFTIGIDSGGSGAAFEPGLYYAYNQTPLAVPFTMAAKAAGINGITVFAENTGADEDFYIGNTAYGWIEGCEGNYTDGNWAETDWLFHPQISDNYFSNAFGHSSGTNDSNITVRTFTSGGLFENTTLERGHFPFMFEWGAAGNVAGYLYIFGQYDITDFTDSGVGTTVLPCSTINNTCSNKPAINSHGLQPQFNLLEGITGNMLEPDNIWGSSFTFSSNRNQWLGTTLMCGNGNSGGGGRGTVSCAGTGGANAWQISNNYEIEAFSIQDNFIGDIVGSTTQQALHNTQGGGALGQVFQTTGACGPSPCGSSSRTFGANADAFSFGYFSVQSSGGGSFDTSAPFTTALIHGVFTNMNTTTTWSGSLTHTLAASYYLTSKPAWFGSQPFPLNGPDVTGGTGIGGFANKTPAQVMYESLGGTNGTGSPIAGFNAQAFFSSSGSVTISPSSENFGSVVVSVASSPVTFTITNGSGTTATSATPSVTGGNTGDFAITNSGAGSCSAASGTLTASSSCTFSVIFTPGALGSRSTTLSVSYSGGDGASPVTSALSGTGISSPTAGTPSCTPPGGTYNATLSVSCSVSGGAPVMCYSTSTTPATNGGSGCSTGTLYSGAISISSTGTVLKVIAGGTGFTDGTVDSGTYTLTVATPTFNPVAGTYFGAQSVTISTSTSGATITYTTDGSTPVPGSHGTVYSGPVSVPSSLTIKAAASASGFTNSSVGSATYVINPIAIAPVNPAAFMQ